jgi:sensor c-di-GMP phosphodiesterase-like protein
MIQKLDEVKQEAEAMKAKGDLAKGVQELQEAAKVSKEKIAVILREQQNLNRKNFWKEWGISLGLGVMSSIIATYIWVNYLG